MSETKQEIKQQKHIAKTDKPLVSLILPVYNVSRYLSICLDSILAQTYSDFEVILIDDGSTDESLQICQNYAEKDQRFRVIHQENKGLASARNTGLRNRNGEYFYFIDSDDCIHPQLLEIVVSIAEKEQADLVQINLKDVPSGYQDFRKEPDIENIYLAVQDNLQHFSLVQSLYNLDRDNQNFAKDIRLTTTVVWTKLYRSSAYQDFLFPEGMRMHEDQMVAHRILQIGGGIVFLDVPLYFYRQSDASLIRVGWTPKRLAILDCYEDRLKCCEEVRDYELNGANNRRIQDSVPGKQESELDDAFHSPDYLPGGEKPVGMECRALVNYIYERYLVCCFRNYDMVNRNMKGEEKTQQQKAILQRMKQLLSSGRGQMGKGKLLFFKTFTALPQLFIAVFALRNKIFKK